FGAWTCVIDRAAHGLAVLGFVGAAPTMPPTTKKRVSPRKSPVQSRSQDTVDVIVEAAARILAEVGPERFNTNRIARPAGVSVGSLCQSFPRKDAILVALARRQLDGDRRAVMTAVTASVGRPLAQRVRAVVRALIEIHRMEEDVRRLTMTSHRAYGFWVEHEE